MMGKGAERAAGRRTALGPVGAYLHSLVSQDRGLLAVADMSPDAQLVEVGLVRKRRGGLVAAACSVLLCDWVVQVPLKGSEILKIAEGALPEYGMFKRLVETEKNIKKYYSLLDSSKKTGVYKRKSHPGASNKVNVFFSELWPQVRDNFVDVWDNFLDVHSAAAGFFDDQAGAALIYACGLCDFVPKPAAYAVACVRDPKSAKNLSTVLKSLGANATPFGARLVEGDALQGRAVGTLDLGAEARGRTSGGAAMEGMARFPPDDLRRVVRSILREELTDEVEFAELDKFWDRRWEWCVNGSHARLLERLKPQYKVAEIPGVDRWYRRMFAEALTDEPVSGWDGGVTVSASEKLEHGKVRAIFACDSVSYFAFEHLLRPVERKWKGRRVLLDPGANGHVGMVERVRALRAKGATSLMLDFDDFNSQHTLEAQQVVVDELCKATGYPAELAEKLVGSFEKMDMYVRGRYAGRAAGTLMSGHRGTSFLNTVLNAAYIRLGCGEALYNALKSIHVGDDVYLSCPTYAAAVRVMQHMSATPCRLNPTKQSLGHGSAEFLRVASNDRAAYGYLARAVSGVVSGNWVNEFALQPREALASMVQSARTLMNRGMSPHLYKLLLPSVVRMTGGSRRTLSSVLSGNIALGTGPQYSFHGYRMSIETREVAIPLSEDDAWLKSAPDYATIDYLSKAAAPIERKAMELTGNSVKSAMLGSSYGKALVGGKLGLRQLDYLRSGVRVAAGSTSVVAALRLVPKFGVLDKYPVLHMLRGQLNYQHLRELVAEAGGDPFASDLEAEAWGTGSSGAIVQGWLSYSDACLLGNRTSADVLYTTSPYYV